MNSCESRAAVAETHVSVVMFIGDRAYKLKKPVAMGFPGLFDTRGPRGSLPARS
jgi:aminoglycoside phosphotransferase family enzyme